MAPLGDPLVPPDLRGWFDRIVGVVRRSSMPLLAIQLPVALAVSLISYGMSLAIGAPSGGAALAELGPLGGAGQNAPAPDPFDGMASLLALAAVLAVGAFGQCAGVFVAMRDAAGRPPTVEQTLLFARSRMPALIGWEVFAGVLMLVGFVLLIVPGLYLAVVFSATLVGVVTVERGSPARCFELVNRRFWPTLGRLALAMLAVLLYQVVSGYVVSALSSPDSIMQTLLRGLASVPVGIVGVGVVAVTYAELRFRESASVTTRGLVDELDR
jgi:hypothetical protein